MKEKTINIFLGFFYFINFLLGTGYLGMPYAFFYSGYLAAIPTLLIIAFITWVGANYMLEVLARAQALEYLENFSHDNDTTESEVNRTEFTPPTPTEGHPRFEITDSRKFEIPELCGIFYGKYLKYIYLVLLCVGTFMGSLSFATIAGSAWATNIPFHNFGPVEKCSEEAFFHRTLPTGGCLYAYYLSLTMFAVIAITLSLFDLKEQVTIQVAFGLLRFITIAAILIYCIVRLSIGGNACMDQLGLHNATTINTGITSMVLRFEPRAWLLSIPVLTFGFPIHISISSIVHTIKQKRHLHWLLLVVLLVCLICYISAGVVVPLWFGVSIQETLTLNWAIFTSPRHSVPLRILSYCIVLFPSIDVITVYTISVHVIVNSLFILITGQDTSRNPKYRFDWIFKVFLRFVAALTPILVAFGVSNLIYVVKVSGLIMLSWFLFPFLLQFKSIYVCKKKFSPFHANISDSHSEEKENLDEDKKGDITPGLGREQKSLLGRDSCRKKKRALYMTPYSNVIISHPVCAWIMAIVTGCLIIIGVSNVFVQQEQLTCDSLIRNRSSLST